MQHEHPFKVREAPSGRCRHLRKQGSPEDRRTIPGPRSFATPVRRRASCLARSALIDSAQATLQQRVEQLLFYQSELLDQKQWGTYIDLFAEEGVYWMPVTPEQTEWMDSPSIFAEDKRMMEIRMGRVMHPNVWSQAPQWGTSHVVGNVVIESVSEVEIQVRSRFHMMELRRDATRHFAGTYRHTLKRIGDGFKIVLQRVDLLNGQALFDYVLQIWVLTHLHTGGQAMALTAVKAVQAGGNIRAFSLYIDGKWVPAADGAVADDFNPATGALFAEWHKPGGPMPTGRRGSSPVHARPGAARSCQNEQQFSCRRRMYWRVRSTRSGSPDRRIGLDLRQSHVRSVLLHRPVAQCGR